MVKDPKGSARAPHPWIVVAAETQEMELRKALEATAGNISEAAGKLALSRQQVTRLVKKYDLGEFAAKLRVEAGGTRRGRQWVRPRAVDETPDR